MKWIIRFDTYIHTCMHIPAFTCTNTHVYIHVRIQSYALQRQNTHTSAANPPTGLREKILLFSMSNRLYLHLHTHTYMHACTHTYIDWRTTIIYTCTHTNVCTSKAEYAVLDSYVCIYGMCMHICICNDYIYLHTCACTC
jgi:hypothetical protein